MVFGILGGDYRYKFLYDMLLIDKHKVYVYSNKYLENTKECNNIDEFLKKIDVLIASIPFTKDNKTVFNITNELLDINVLIDKMVDNNIKLLCAGVIGKNRIENIEEKGIKVLDFFEDEAVAILNAIPTAEGAIQTAMEESYKTIFDSKCLVLGYGRCGKILSNMLKGIGANVTVTYRKQKDYAYINSYGLESVNLYEIENIINDFDFIFNTIPYEILNRNILQKVNRESVIIDLAQAPGGVDYNCARELDLKAIYCPSLPGRVAPYTAAKILKDSLIEYCKGNL